MKMCKTSLLILILFTGKILGAQVIDPSNTPLNIARTYINQHLEDWGLSQDDIEGMTVSDNYTDKASNITRIYFQQNVHGILVHNAILNINISKDGRVFFAGNRFVNNVTEKINTVEPVLHASDAIKNLAAHLDLPHETIQLNRQENNTQYVFDKGTMATEEITANLCYQRNNEKLSLSWDVLISPSGTHDKWSTRVDAVTGEILEENNWTVYCHVDEFSYTNEDSVNNKPFKLTPHTTSLNGAQYNVWPSPIQSPGHGPRTIMTDPADTIASPYGWHDVNGQHGAEYTITRGNNVYAYEGRDDLGYSAGDEPNGGYELHFDFPYDPLWEPEQYMEASTVNVFYSLNYLHDFFYHFGFDEAAGNFQQNNYGNGGLGSDFLYAVNQSGANIGYKNNAFYRHSNEGDNSAIHMYIFTSKKRFLTINEPSHLAGEYFTSLPREGWGPGAYINEVPITGELVMVYDAIENPATTDGCEDFTNAQELAGKIAFMDRGGCSFGFKALKAQNAGAIGVVVASFDDDEYNLVPGSEGAQVNIPVVMITASDAQAIRKLIEDGLNVSFVDPGESNPKVLDSGLDNGIIAHEFGHGISARIAGGPNNMCLKNAEQMGEGWSDFFALSSTVKPEDTGEMSRGFCSYLFNEPSTGKGFRRYPYTTDMSINPLTYGNVAINQEVHELGEVWGAILWDMYWALVEKYGWSENPYEPSSGNYKAVKLVIEGLKNVICSPGFVDARNAILAAEEELYNGQDNCLLWEVFARRGLGYSAEQGSSFDAGDQKEAFDVLPVCSDRLMIEKSATELINAGDEINVSIKIGNFRHDTASNVIVTDEIPAGTTFKVNSSNLPALVEGNTVIFQLGKMEFGEEDTITYTLQSDPDNWSQRNFLDEVAEHDSSNWLTYFIDFGGDNEWTITDSLGAHSGQYCWHSKEVTERSRQALELNPDVYTFHVDGQYPVLRFYHRYNTLSAYNGGIVDIKEAGSPSWSQVGDDMIRNGYPDRLVYLTFAATNLKAFSGYSGEEFKATYVDLGRWKGKDIQIRFRFGVWPSNHNSDGWLIDDIEFMDMRSYNGEACVTSDQGDYECTILPEAGTIVDSKDIVSSTPSHQTADVQIFPNPARDLFTIILPNLDEQNIRIRLLTMDGLTVLTKTFQSNDQMNFDTANIPSGMYLVEVTTPQGKFVHKVILL